MADKFNRSTGEWESHAPRISIPPEEVIEAIALEELNHDAAILRKVARTVGKDAALSVALGQAVVVVTPEQFVPEVPQTD